MKKVLSCLLAVLLLASISVMAFAAEAVPSVEAEKTAPVVAGAVDADGNDVTSAIIITDYADKDTLPEEKQAAMDEAAEALKDLAALVEGNEELAELLGDSDYDCEALFDVTFVGDVAVPVKVDLELANAENFAALLQLVDDGVALVETELNEEVLTATLEGEGVYAVLSFVKAE